MSPIFTFFVLENEEDHTSENQVSFNSHLLAIYDKSSENIEFIIADNENTNKKIARLIGVPVIGC